MSEKFQIFKMHKLQERMEQMAHEWVWEDISEHFKVEDIEDLNKEQVDEIYAYAESEECYDDYVGMVLRSICDNWEGMQGEWNK